jgi:hypothetical protein
MFELMQSRGVRDFFFPRERELIPTYGNALQVLRLLTVI